jgi:predicted transcriptional regulator
MYSKGGESSMPKLTVEFNDKMNDILEQLAEEKGTTKVDVLRRAVALYKYLDAEQKDGKVSITQDNKIVKDIVLP